MIKTEYFDDGNRWVFISDENKEMTLWLFYENDEITQIRFLLSDDPEEGISNYALSLSNKHFTKFVNTSYVKEFERNGKQIRETYYDDELFMYSETIVKGRFKITEDFSPQGYFSGRDIYEYSPSGQLISNHSKVIDYTGFHNTTKTYYDDEGNEIHQERKPMPLIKKLLEEAEDNDDAFGFDFDFDFDFDF